MAELTGGCGAYGVVQDYFMKSKYIKNIISMAREMV